MMEVHWMVWLIALLRGAVVDGVAWMTNRVAFCMALLCVFYTAIVQDISTSQLALSNISTRLNEFIALLKIRFLAPMAIRTQSRDIARFISSTSQPRPVFGVRASLLSVAK